MTDTITLVLPWFGPDTAGGAEAQARQLSQALRAQGAQVEVWTTTGRDAFSPPEPYYPEGRGEFGGVPVRRFPLTPPARDPRVPPAVARRGLLRGLPDFPTHELRLLASLVSSDALLEAVAAEGAGRQFVFVLYPFPTSFWGVLLAGERASLLPCLHDEPYARYSTVAWMFRRARRVLANSPAERALALRLYDLPPERVVVAGEGIDLAPRGDGAAFRARQGIEGPLLFYTGRRDAGKNIPLLLSYTREYWARRGGPLTLALAGGREPLDMPPALGALVRDLGYLSVQEKHDAYAAADLFVHAGTHESFSIVLMEAWLQGTPALVHADCAVTREAAEASGAGLSFRDFGGFAAALDALLADPDLRCAMGARGRAWVLEHCRWDEVARRTAEALAS
ncbi:MAG TPA: glycosyltransferase family 4 protein [Roseiflexaceae bacterium]|nr:glycosyltransferase family 4 protein [Roseiflexaceae bacterium]